MLFLTQKSVASPIGVDNYNSKGLPSGLGTGKCYSGKGGLLLCKLYLHLLSSPIKFCQQIVSAVDNLKDVCNF